MEQHADEIAVGDWFVGAVDRADLMGNSARKFPGGKVRVQVLTPSNDLALPVAKLFAALPAGHPCQLSSDEWLWVIGSRPTRSRMVCLTWWGGRAHPTRDALAELATELKGQA